MTFLTFLQVKVKAKGEGIVEVDKRGRGTEYAEALNVVEIQFFWLNSVGRGRETRGQLRCWLAGYIEDIFDLEPANYRNVERRERGPALKNGVSDLRNHSPRMPYFFEWLGA